MPMPSVVSRQHQHRSIQLSMGMSSPGYEGQQLKAGRSGLAQQRMPRQHALQGEEDNREQNPRRKQKLLETHIHLQLTSWCRERTGPERIVPLPSRTMPPGTVHCPDQSAASFVPRPTCAAAPGPLQGQPHNPPCTPAGMRPHPLAARPVFTSAALTPSNHIWALPAPILDERIPHLL